MFYFPIGVMLFSLILAAPALGQTAKDLPDLTEAGPVAARGEGKVRRDAKFCRGRIEGRYWVEGHVMRLRGVLKVAADGVVLPTKGPLEKWTADVWTGRHHAIGGRLTLHDPVRDRSPNARNRCFASGCVKLDGGRRVCFDLLFLHKGGVMTGDGHIDSPSRETSFTAGRY